MVLAEIVSDRTSTKRGGKEFVDWCEKALTFALGAVPTVASGGIVFPQLGVGAGVAHSFFTLGTLRAISDETYEEVKRLTSGLVDQWFQLPDTVRLVSDSRFALQVVAIHAGSPTDSPIGLLWGVCDDLHRSQWHTSVGACASLVAVVVTSEKSSQALDELAAPTWRSQSAFRSVAAEAASRCCRATACKDVIIWEILQVANQSVLSTVASTARISIDMAVGEGLAGNCAAHGQVMVVRDLTNRQETDQFVSGSTTKIPNRSDLNWKSGCFIPIDTGDGKLTGVLAVFSQRVDGINELDLNIAKAFVERLVASYAHFRRLDYLTELESKLSAEAPAIDAAMLAVERIHDAKNSFNLAQDALNRVSSRLKADQSSTLYSDVRNAQNQLAEGQRLIARLAKYAGPIRYNFKKQDLSTVLSEAQADLEYFARKNRIRIKNRYGKKLVAEFDKEYMQRAFANILGNAIDFLGVDSKQGERLIEVIADRQSSLIEIEIRDNGPGISPNDLPKVFDYLFTTRKRGMGFGLPIAKRIVEDHEGQIRVASQWGYWTSFVVSLPAIED